MTAKKTQKTGENKAKKPSGGTAAPKMVPVAAVSHGNEAVREEYAVGGAPRLEGVNVTIGGPGAEAYQEIIPGCEGMVTAEDAGRRRREMNPRVIISEPKGLAPQFSAIAHLERMAKALGMSSAELALKIIVDSPEYRRHVREFWAAEEVTK